jgi:hypothetical protein
MERTWRTRRNHAGVNGIGIGLCFRSRRSCYEKLGKRVEAGLCIACGKEPCEWQEPSSVTTRDASGKEQPGPSVRLPEAQTEAEFPKGVPGGPGVGFLEYRYNASRRDPARYETLRARLEREVPDSRRAPGELHPNRARQLLSVLVSVPNVADAVRQSERLGFAAGEDRYMKDLGE